MEDKELYEFFRSRKSTFDREPAESLWEKIDAGLTAPAPQASKPLWLKSWVLLPVTALVIGVGLYMYKNTEAATDTPARTVKDVRTAAPASLPNQNGYQIDDSEIYGSTRTTVDTVRKKIPFGVIKKQETISYENHQFVIAPAGLPAVSNRNASIAMDTVRVNTDNLITETIITKGRIVVTTKEKLTNAQFKALTYEILEENRQSIGSTLIVKAPGHAIFRHIIKGMDNTYPAPVEVEAIQFRNDTVKALPSGNLKTKIFTIKNQGDSLQDTIDEFEQ